METDYYPDSRKEELKQLLNDQKYDNSDKINDDNNNIIKNHKKVRSSYVSTKCCVASVRIKIVKRAK